MLFSYDVQIISFYIMCPINVVFILMFISVMLLIKLLNSQRCEECTEEHLFYCESVACVHSLGLHLFWSFISSLKTFTSAELQPFVCNAGVTEVNIVGSFIVKCIIPLWFFLLFTPYISSA